LHFGADAKRKSRSKLTIKGRMKRGRFLIGAVPVAAATVASADAQVPDAIDERAIAPYGAPSVFERDVQRLPAGSPNLAFTPLGQQFGSVTPSGLAFVRNHAGVPTIDPRSHVLLVHGLVGRPLTFSMNDLARFPAVERAHFIECAGNSARGWQRIGRSVQFSHGLVQGAVWTGVPLRAVLDEAGVRPDARWLVAEGADNAYFDRSLPLDLVRDDALLAYAQNGEMLRPEQGYPLRLIVPGCEGSTNIKWLRRLKLVAKPVYSREETAEYSEVRPNGSIGIFDFVMGVKSVITSPSPGERLSTGSNALRGLAWSGSGAIQRVDVSLDGGRVWTSATLTGTAAAKSLTPFALPFTWETGKAMTLMSRAVDDAQHVQPTLDALVAARGDRLRYHVNAIARWAIAPDGGVTNLDG
jgi:sulfane dehydrogenase subunit SoxC